MKYAILFLGALLFMTSCKKEETVDVDPRAVFVGEYETEDHDVTITSSFGIDTMLTIEGGIEVEIELEGENTNTVEIEGLDDLLEETFQEIMTAVHVDFEDEVIAEISGNSFEIEETDFEISGGSDSVSGVFSGEGNLDGNTLTLEYEYSISDSSDELNVSGEVEMEK